jgi:serine/threonine protein kinase
MTHDAQSIFDQVCDLEKDRRLAKVAELCGHDAGLRSEVESLLEAHDTAGEFLNEPTIDSRAADPNVSGGATISAGGVTDVEISEGPGSIVDRYKLLEKIGEGGFGVVYMAQQSEPIRRRVALKIIKLGMDTKQVVARFEAERQALAMMDHPNIARVIDGGSTATGRPYFVMELVRGDPITAYCDQNRLPLRARLELFQQVCRAIEHAHQKGIIHRDIKPSNVLVTTADDKPLVKVIDFGIAKATSCDLTDKTLFTEFRQLVGTPLYMSPEQAERSGVDVDTRTDVYALGVVLYEMLTGRTPLDPKKLNSAAWGEFQRMIVEDEPTKPSVMVSTAIGEMVDVAKRRATEPSRLGSSLRGDLDWIVLKSLEKDRSRRYSTASHFAADIERFLNDEAVDATPPSSIYQLRKFARRNRALLLTTAAVFLALIAGLIATSTAAMWAIRQQKIAVEAQQQAEKQKRAALRSATIVGAAGILTEQEAESLAESWEEQLAEMRSRKGSDDAEVVKQETQYTNWYANWLLRVNRADEASELINHCFDRARAHVGIEDPAFLSLCNLRIHVNDAVSADRQQNADTFGELMKSLQAIHGQQRADVLAPEYAAALANAGRDEEAAAALQRYLDYRKDKTTLLSLSENASVELAIDRLMNWGQAYPELLRQLQAVRETGAPTAAVATIENDKELADDLATLQGRWKHDHWERGKIVERMVCTFDQHRSVTQWLDEDGNQIKARDGRFELSRSGATKVMTVYLGGGGSPNGEFNYRLKKDHFTIVTGMLGNRLGEPPTELRKWTRIKDDDAEQ